MIKVGITGADSLPAGELIRLLINHPETEITSLHAPSCLGRNPSAVHHGLIGENIGNFSDRINPEELDIIFFTDNDKINEEITANKDQWEDLKIIDLSHTDPKFFNQDAFNIGLSEVNRKNLVRECKTSWIPSPMLSGALISLAPFAKYMLLNSDIQVHVSMPGSLVKGQDIENNDADELRKILQVYQPSFASSIKYNHHIDDEEQRVVIMKASFDCSLSLEEIEKIFESLYDDHNFTFITSMPVKKKEVEGTQKCVLNFSKPSPSEIEITSYIDGRMRGGAGDAVHVMNLFKGLYEKTGLALKCSAYESGDSEQPASWFA